MELQVEFTRPLTNFNSSGFIAFIKAYLKIRMTITNLPLFIKFNLVDQLDFAFSFTLAITSVVVPLAIVIPSFIGFTSCLINY